MSQTVHIVDAFAYEPFLGNPAAVCILDGPAEEKWMGRVARAMNLSESAFLHPIDGGFGLRWFTPAVEVKLCGHATLASAFVLWEIGVLKIDEVARFHTLSGWLECRRSGDWIAMDFPAKVPEPCTAPDGIEAALGASPLWVGSSGMDYLVEVADETTLRGLRPDFPALARLPVRGDRVLLRGQAVMRGRMEVERRIHRRESQQAGRHEAVGGRSGDRL